MKVDESGTGQTGITKQDRQRQVRHRRDLIIVAVVSLIVGGLISRFGFGDFSQETKLTPPPAWNIACVPEDGDSERASGVPVATVTPEPVQVYVSGAVVDPKVVQLPPKSLLADALDAVGGITEDADLDALNLAAPLSQNQHIVVPRKTTLEATTKQPVVVDVSPETLLDLNTATAEMFETLPRIGPSRAEDIIAYREENGPFAKKEDIQNVSGIGPSTYELIAPYITVEP